MLEKVLTAIRKALPSTVTFAKNVDTLWNSFYVAASEEFAKLSEHSFYRTYPVMLKPPKAVSFPKTGPDDLIIYVEESSPMYYMMAAAMAEMIITHDLVYIAVPDIAPDLIDQLTDIGVPPTSLTDFVKDIPAIAAVTDSDLKATSLAFVADMAFVDAAQRLSTRDIFKAAEAYAMTKVLRYNESYEQTINDMLDFLGGLLKPFNRSISVTIYRARHNYVKIVLLHIRIV